MKKNGFTLAEVLITLAIIGVVATLTLPALLTNTAEQQAKTALKKGINTLTEAAQMNQAVAGFDYASLTVAGVGADNTETQSLYGLLSQRASVDYTKSKKASDIKLSSNANDTYGTYKGGTTIDNGNYALFFRDGSALLFPENTVTDEDAAKMQEDNLVYGIKVIYDTNGTKGPNILSNCDSAAKGKEDASTNTCTPKSRVIKDQFGVRLRGGYAVPNGPAARWAFEN